MITELKIIKILSNTEITNYVNIIITDYGFRRGTRVALVEVTSGDCDCNCDLVAYLLSVYALLIWK